ncbi:MAG: TadE family protein [Actinomycetota bacterium]
MGRRRPTDRRQRGATTIEAAVVTPIFLLILMALFEMAFLVHNYLKVTGAAGVGVRSVTVAGSAPEADYLTMQSILHGLSTFEADAVEQVVLYRADGPDDEVPLGCRSVPIPSGLECNGYEPADFFLPYVDATGIQTGHWGCGTNARDTNWCPTTRQVALSDPGGPDHVGVYIRVTLPSITGILGSDRTLEINRVARIEPAGS